MQVPPVEGSRLSTRKVTPEEPLTHKRIVMFHTTGPFKGLARIAGRVEGTAKQISDALLSSIHYKEGDEEKEQQHWKTLPRAVWYREWQLKSAGKLNDFHGAQV